MAVRCKKCQYPLHPLAECAEATAQTTEYYMHFVPRPVVFGEPRGGAIGRFLDTSLI